MSASKKRRKLPEEDLAAAVAEIINSPITRSNLSFLRAPEPTEASPTPTGSDCVAAVVVPTPTGVEENLQPWRPANPERPLWQAEGLGTIFEQGRVRRIQQAQDALSLVEEKVYDLLWGPKNQRKDEFRLVHYSLQRIATEARLNIKTVRELIPRLIDKGFIRIEHEADVRRNIPTLYRVASYAAVLNDQRRRNRFFVAKTGKGVFYVHPVSASLDSIPMGVELTPAGLRPAGDSPWPAGRTTIGPLGARESTPMGAGGSPSLDNSLDKAFRQTTPATYTVLAASIQDILGLGADENLLAAMIYGCHQNALASTGEGASEEELLYFTATKARVLAKAPNIRNHLAVLRKAVPECFLGESFRAYRRAAAARKRKAAEEEQQLERQAAESEVRYASWARISERHRSERGYDMQAIAADPELDELGKRQAEGMLARLGRFTPSGL